MRRFPTKITTSTRTLETSDFLRFYRPDLSLLMAAFRHRTIPARHSPQDLRMVVEATVAGMEEAEGEETTAIRNRATDVMGVMIWDRRAARATTIRRAEVIQVRAWSVQSRTRCTLTVLWVEHLICTILEGTPSAMMRMVEDSLSSS